MLTMSILCERIGSCESKLTVDIGIAKKYGRIYVVQEPRFCVVGEYQTVPETFPLPAG